MSTGDYLLYLKIIFYTKFIKSKSFKIFHYRLKFIQLANHLSVEHYCPSPNLNQHYLYLHEFLELSGPFPSLAPETKPTAAQEGDSELD